MSTGTGVKSSPITSEGRTGSKVAPALVMAAQDVLAQGLELLHTVGEEYAELVGPPFDVSIGQHYRHVVEHFQCLLRNSSSGEVNYDARQRDRRIETDKEFAETVTRELILELEDWTEAKLEERCEAVSSVDYESSYPSRIPSNYARELAYCIGHTVHHYAIIRLVCNQIGVAVPPRFGYAPSTIKHQANGAAH